MCKSLIECFILLQLMKSCILPVYNQLMWILLHEQVQFICWINTNIWYFLYNFWKWSVNVKLTLLYVWPYIICVISDQWIVNTYQSYFDKGNNSCIKLNFGNFMILLYVYIIINYLVIILQPMYCNLCYL